MKAFGNYRELVKKLDNELQETIRNYENETGKLRKIFDYFRPSNNCIEYLIAKQILKNRNT